MGASSVTGVGLGQANKPTLRDLSVLANGPQIVITGIAASADLETSPPSNGGTVVFPAPLSNPSTDYVVMLTTVNGGDAYVTDLDEEDGLFSGFDFVTESECDVMYCVMNIGIRPVIV